ncbi:hypothetical protein CK203_100714 [Vitis vinifera]|uniref:Uncharacterized protein n=1 Tax=Vitis vinifera TaxID=29760 RepID=A0A438FHS2_VITVI|nr:hypothetical protein CK203_100714 [Vitis vinifera]
MDNQIDDTRFWHSSQQMAPVSSPYLITTNVSSIVTTLLVFPKSFLSILRLGNYFPWLPVESCEIFLGKVGLLSWMELRKLFDGG